MPRFTDRQVVTDVILEQYALQLYVENSSLLMTEILAIDDSDEDSDADADNQGDPDEPSCRLSDALLGALHQIHSQRYLEPRVDIPKSSQNLTLILTEYKTSRPDIFRRCLRLTSSAFDTLLSAIQDHPVFTNDSRNEQAPVKIQLAVALYRFGHFGNGSSLLEVGLWAGIGWGTVDLYTRRVMTAVCEDKFRKSAIRWPSEGEKEAAKAWIEAQSCPAWRDGYIMVDGTAAVLHVRPAFFGNSFFDRKQKYSLNVQVRY